MKNGGFLIIMIALFGVVASALGAGRQAEEKTYRLTVSFYSICCGTDSKARERVDHFLAAYEKKHGKRLPKEKIYWGKEGEIDYCFDLSGLSEKERNTVISQLKEAVKESTLTRIEENTPCRKGRNN